MITQIVSLKVIWFMKTQRNGRIPPLNGHYSFILGNDMSISVPSPSLLLMLKEP
jgi:hypothetical protein